MSMDVIDTKPVCFLFFVKYLIKVINNCITFRCPDRLMLDFTGMNYTDQRLLEGLREKKSACIKFMYREYFPLVKSIVTKNSGTYQDAEDVFQDGLIVLFLKTGSGMGNLNCSLKTFFYSVCQNIWMQRLDRKWRLLYQEEMVEDPAVNYNDDDDLVDEANLEKTRLYQVHFLTLPPECQQLLRLFLDKTPLKVIAGIMGFKNMKYAKTRKYLCKKMLRKRILSDPRSKHFLSYD